MAFLFMIFTIATRLFPKLNAWYRRGFQEKVETINRNIGIGFAIPLLKIFSRHFLDASEATRVVAAFFFTSVVFWPLLLVTGYALLITLSSVLIYWRPTPEHQQDKEDMNLAADPEPDATSGGREPRLEQVQSLFEVILLFLLLVIGLSTFKQTSFILDLAMVTLFWLASTTAQASVPERHVFLRAVANPGFWS
ncbi:uncharacterized protein BROUX77_003170 [Berkeleyomyces rouxiae]|uniref:uncharacterized protein n=1 Tax=Berkeleyomyces rouxiae TaxID=2035830 RepID=UPI003B7B7994